MRKKEDILEAKFAYYDQTLAAVEFAMTEHAEEFALEFGEFIKEELVCLKGKSIPGLLKDFKTKNNI